MKNINFILSLIVVVVIIIGSFYVGANFGDNLKFTSRSTNNSSTVLERVKTIAELNTIEMYYNEIIDFSDAKYFNDIKLPFTTKKLIFTVKARVKAGVDLSKLSVRDIEVDENYIRIILPKPSVTSKEILESALYDEKNALFNEVTSEDTLTLLGEFLKSLDQKSIDNGIIEKAENNTRLAVMNLLELMDFKEIEIVFDRNE